MTGRYMIIHRQRQGDRMVVDSYTREFYPPYEGDDDGAAIALVINQRPVGILAELIGGPVGTDQMVYCYYSDTPETQP